MAFTRKFLKEQGVSEDKIDVIMAERNRTMSDYILKSEMDEQIEKEVQKRITEEMAKIPNVDVKESDEYKSLLNKVNMFNAFETEDFNDVKKPYKEMIWDKLDHSEKHTPYNEQISGLKEKYPDMFASPVVAEEDKPTFGGETGGSVPSGDKKDSFSEYWGYGKK